MVFRHDFGLFRVSHIGRSHDLHAMFVKHIENIPAETGIQVHHVIRPVAVDVEFIGDAEIAQGEL